YSKIALFLRLMKNNYYNQRLIKTALYTSPLIAVMAIAPIAIGRSISTALILAAIAGFTGLVLLMWFINWSIYYFIVAYRRQESSNKLHYLLSYLLTFVVVFFVESYLAPNGIEMPNTFYTDPGWAIIFSLNT